MATTAQSDASKQLKSVKFDQEHGKGGSPSSSPHQAPGVLKGPAFASMVIGLQTGGLRMSTDLDMEKSDSGVEASVQHSSIEPHHSSRPSTGSEIASVVASEGDVELVSLMPEKKKRLGDTFAKVVRAKGGLQNRGIAYVPIRKEADKELNKYIVIQAALSLLSFVFTVLVLELEWNPENELYDKGTVGAVVLEALITVLGLLMVWCLYKQHAHTLINKFPEVKLRWWRPFTVRIFWAEVVAVMLHLPPIPHSNQIMFEMVSFLRLYAVAKLVRFHKGTQKIRDGSINSGLAPNQSPIFAIKSVIRQDPWMSIGTVAAFTLPIFSYALFAIARITGDFNSYSDSIWFMFNLMAIQNPVIDPHPATRPVLIVAMILGVVLGSFVVSTLMQSLQLDATQAAAVNEIVLKQLKLQMHQAAGRYIYFTMKLQHFRRVKKAGRKELKYIAEKIPVMRSSFLKARTAYSLQQRELASQAEVSQMVVKMGTALTGLDDRLAGLKSQLWQKIYETKLDVVENSMLLRSLTVEKYGVLDTQQATLGEQLQAFAKWFATQVKEQESNFTRIDAKSANLQSNIENSNKLAADNHGLITEQVQKHSEVSLQRSKELHGQHAAVVAHAAQEFEWNQEKGAALQSSNTGISGQVTTMGAWAKQQAKDEDAHLVALQTETRQVDVHVLEEVALLADQASLQRTWEGEEEERRAAEVEDALRELQSLQSQSAANKMMLDDVARSVADLAQSFKVSLTETTGRIEAMEKSQISLNDTVGGISKAIHELHNAIITAVS